MDERDDLTRAEALGYLFAVFFPPMGLVMAAVAHEGSKHAPWIVLISLVLGLVMVYGAAQLAAL